MATNPNVEIDRHKYIGGSDLPAILSLSEYSNVWKLARVKAQVQVDDDNFVGNRFTTNGNLMEPQVRNYMNNTYGFNFIEDTQIDNNRMYRGNCDGIDRKIGALLEVKTFLNKLKVDYYTPQCQFYMEVFNIPVCLLVGYHTNENFYKGEIDNIEQELDENNFDSHFDKDRLKIVRIFRNKEYFLKMEKRIKIFQELVSILNNNKNMEEKDFYEIYYKKILDHNRE